jgi:antitoxin component of RelBE/YafQ-DinJ toxin-antitoxin module
VNKERYTSLAIEIKVADKFKKEFYKIKSKQKITQSEFLKMLLNKNKGEK